MRRTGGDRAGMRLAEHSAAVFAYAFYLLGSREEAEDVTQVAFLQAHRALVGGEQLVRPRAWLSTVVKRQAFNRWRGRREIAAHWDAPDRPDGDRQDAAEQLGQVRAVLLSLPEPQH